MDGRFRNLEQDGHSVTSLQLVGLAVEYLLKVAQKKGIGSVRLVDVVASVSLNHVVYNGRKKRSHDVCLSDDEKELTLKVAREVRRVMMVHHFNVLDVVKREAGVGSHDLICDRQLVASNATCFPDKYSVELKLRRILSDSGRNKFRKDSRVSALNMLKAAIDKSRDQWAGRLVLLVEFGPGPLHAWRAVRCDLYQHATQQWQGLFGWPGSRSQSLGALASRPVAGPGPRPSQLDHKCDAVIAELKKESWAIVNNRPMCSISLLLEKAGTAAAARAKPTIGERLPSWKKRKGWDEGDLSRQPRKRGKRGGAPEHVASEPVLRDLFFMFA